MAGQTEAALKRRLQRNRKPLIWVIDSGLPGVTNQCLGVAHAIATLAPCRIETVRLRLRSRMLQPLFQAALARNLLDDDKRSAWPLGRLFFSGPMRGDERPDIVVSALGRGEFAGAYLRRSAGAIALHIGVPGRLPSDCFDFLVVVGSKDVSRLRRPHVRLEISPTPVLMAEVAEKRSAAENRHERRRLWAVLVGGNGAGYFYRPQDWSRLAESLRRLAERLGAGCLLTTSRRTGDRAETILKQGLMGEHLVDAVWHAEGGRKAVTDYLAAAEIVFCTEDSRSMISDAIAAGKPVYAIRPETCSPDPRNAEFLAEQEAKRRIKRVRIAEMADLDVGSDMTTWFRPLTECWSVGFLAALTAGVPQLRETLDGHPSEPQMPATS